jgi:DNA-binding NtrC family response regulator
VISIRLPSLRERRQDIPSLAADLLEQVNRDFRHQDLAHRDLRLSPSAVQFLKKHDWPGNIRQLYNTLLQSAVMAETDQIDRVDLEAALSEMPTERIGALDEPLGEGFDLVKHLEAVQKRYLERALRQAGGVKAQAASLLGYVNYQTLDAQLKRLGVRWPE